MNNNFITYQEALSTIEKHKVEFPIESQDLEDCVGRFLAEDLIADRDFPPFDRVTMDGIAVAFSSFETGQRTFLIESIAAAGSEQQSLKNSANCIEVMTGAMMPNGVDTVIRYEDICVEDNEATINLDTLKHKQNVHFKGMDISEGTILVPKGKCLSSAEINIAATVGKAQLKVRQLPKTVIFSTGNELVPITETPKQHQIRQSNSYGIQASLKQWGINARLEHLPDEKEEMLSTIAKLLKVYDLFIFSGGVSKGKFDYVPEVLEELNIKKHFHKVKQRPGKPFWFGTHETAKTIFALPGNPVSSFACTYVYIRKWLQASLELPQEQTFVALKSDIAFKPELVYFLQAKLENDATGRLIAEPTKNNGSGDFTKLVHAHGFLILPEHKTEFLKGEVYEFIKYR